MRVAVIVLVAFVVVYVVVVGVGVHHHGSESPPSRSARPSLPDYISAAWPITPPFLKVGAGDVSVVGATLVKSTSSFVLAPGQGATIVVPSTSQWYQPDRLLQLQYGPPFAGSVTLAYPPIASVSSNNSPDPLTATTPKQVIVLPKAGGDVSVTCAGVALCTVSL